MAASGFLKAGNSLKLAIMSVLLARECGNLQALRPIFSSGVIPPDHSRLLIDLH